MKKLILKNLHWVIGATVSVVAFLIAWHWYGWHLPLILFLAFLGNNLERTKINDQI